MNNLVFDISHPTTQLNNFNLKKDISCDDKNKVSKYKIEQEERFKQIKKSIDILSNLLIKKIRNNYVKNDKI